MYGGARNFDTDMMVGCWPNASAESIAMPLLIALLPIDTHYT